MSISESETDSVLSEIRYNERSTDKKSTLRKKMDKHKSAKMNNMSGFDQYRKSPRDQDMGSPNYDDREGRELNFDVDRATVHKRQLELDRMLRDEVERNQFSREDDSDSFEVNENGLILEPTPPQIRRRSPTFKPYKMPEMKRYTPKGHYNK